MIFLDSLIDTFNFNAEIKAIELANWKNGIAPLSTFFQQPCQLNTQGPHFYVH